jgi:hypothetical protein
MQIDDITKAAQERLAALDAEAKPHEDALATINAERERLRLVIAAGKGERLLPIVAPVRPIAPWQVDPLGTWIATGTSMPTFGTLTITGHYPDLSKLAETTIVCGTAAPPDPSAPISIPSCSILS